MKEWEEIAEETARKMERLGKGMSLSDYVEGVSVVLDYVQSSYDAAREDLEREEQRS